MTDWQSRIVGLNKVLVNQLHAHHLNGRRHPAPQREALRGSLDALGIVAPPIRNVRTNTILDGHARVEEYLTRDENMEIDVLDVDIAEHEEALFLASFDWITGLAIYDRDTLDTLLKEVQTDEPRLQAMLSEMAAQQGLYFGDAQEQKEDPGGQTDRAEKLAEQYGTELAQVWQLGKHRLIIGDCTDPAIVDRLMQGEQVSLVITDPPYGVNYSEKNTFLNAIARGNRIQAPIEGDYGSKEDIQAMWKAAFKNMSDVMQPGAVVYSFMPQGGDQMMMMMMMMMGAGIEPRHELIWLKNNHVLGRVDYAYKHEPILYAWKEGGHKFYGDFQTSVLEFDKPLKSDLHPTTKPVELVSKLMTNSSQAGESVYDPFLGSGTTLIAAEQTGRICYGCEIHPPYAAVIIQRWETMTGQKAQRPSNMGLTPELAR